MVLWTSLERITVRERETYINIPTIPLHAIPQFTRCFDVVRVDSSPSGKDSTISGLCNLKEVRIMYWGSRITDPIRCV